MDTLRNCTKKAPLLRALQNLPRTLGETYGRILSNVNEDDIEDVLKMLRWLIYADRPLTLGELAETVAISVDDSPVFDPEERLRHPDLVLHTCSTLINLHGDDDKDPVERVVRLAHYSVQEYLLSNSDHCDSRISRFFEERFFEESTAQDYIAKACLTYLLHISI